MIKLFTETGIITIGNDSKGELDKDYNSFLSNSTYIDTVILTNRQSLLKDFTKYKDIYEVNNFEKVLELLSSMSNKDIFIDAYINNLINIRLSQTVSIAKQKDTFLRRINAIANKNNLKIVIFDHVYTTSFPQTNTNHLAGTFYYVSNSTFIYDSVTQDLICKKSRYSDPQKLSFNIKDWKKSLRLEKIKRILE